jgi:hypothetical protein
MASADENRRFIVAAFDAIQRNDVRTFWSVQSKDVAAHVLDQGPLSGEYLGQSDGKFIPCQIFDILEDFRRQTGPTPDAGETGPTPDTGETGATPYGGETDPTPDVGETEQPPDSPPKPVAGGYPRMARIAALADDQFAAIIYVAPSPTDVATGVIGVVVARIEGLNITNVLHFAPALGQDLSFLVQQPGP